MYRTMCAVLRDGRPLQTLIRHASCILPTSDICCSLGSKGAGAHTARPKPRHTKENTRLQKHDHSGIYIRSFETIFNPEIAVGS